MARKLSLEISSSKMSALLENNVKLDNVIEIVKGDNSTVLKEITTSGNCNNFINKRLLPTLKLIADNKLFFKTSSFITKDGQTINYVSIDHNVNSDFIFEPFKKSGISVGTLNIGYDYSLNEIYVSNNIFAALNKFIGTEKFNALVLYLITLNYLFMKLNKINIPEIENNAYSKELKLKLAEDFEFSKLIYQVDKESTVTITPLDIHEIVSVTYDSDSYCNYKYTYELYTIGTYTCLKLENSKGEINYGILYNLGREKGVSPVFLYRYDCIYTSQYMDLPALDDNAIEAILSIRTMSRCIMYKEDMFKDTKVTIVNSDELLASTTLGNSLYKLIIGLLQDVDIEEYCNAKELGNFLGVTLSTTGDVFDNDSIKALYEDDEYAQKLYSQIQPYYEDFDLKDLAPVVKGIAKGDIYSAIFYGESGSGKSTAARVILSRTGIPFISINCSTNIEESDLFGCMIPNPDKESSKDQPFIWQDGLISRACRGNGYGIIIEEGNFARPGILGKLNSLLDESRQIELANGEVLKAPKNFRLFFTCNIAYEGTQRLNKAFVNRFDLVKEFKSAPRKELIDIIMNRVKYTDKTKIESILNVYEAIKKYSRDNNLGLVVSLRQLLTLFTSGNYFKTAYDAVLNILINSAFIEEPDYKEDFIESVLSAFNLKFKI